MPSKCSFKLARSRPPIASPISLNHILRAHLQTRWITGSKFAQARLPSASSTLQDRGLQVHIQTRSNTTSKCISKLAWLRPLSILQNSHHYSLQVHLPTRSITASECISKYTRSWWGYTVELKGRQPISSIPPHLTWHPKRIVVNKQFWVEERTMWVRGYEVISGHDEPHKLHGSMKAWQECVRPRAGRDTVCILNNAMMSMYSGVSQIYTPCRWVHH